MAEPNLKVTGLNHVVIYVSDLERSRRFYMDLLGYEDIAPLYMAMAAKSRAGAAPGGGAPGSAAPHGAAAPGGAGPNPKITGVAFLRCGVQGLDLFEKRGEEVNAGKQMDHMALTVAAADVDELCAALERAGLDSSERTPRSTVNVYDPDGHRVELLPKSAMHFEAVLRESAAANA